MRLIGVLQGTPANDPEAEVRFAAFQQGLQQFGWTDGRNVRFDHRWGEGNADVMRRQAAELAALAPDVILTAGSQATERMLQATHTIPIVFTLVPDPVGSGLVPRLSRPGGNASGFMMFEYNLCGKWPELLKEIAPDVTRAAILRDPTITSGIGQFAVIQSVAPAVGIEVSPIQYKWRDDRNRECRFRLCARAEWRANFDSERLGGDSARADRLARRPIQASGSLL
jgi:putative ABC transport system substrate-binding protein